MYTLVWPFFFIWPKARPFASFPSTVRMKIVDSCQRTWTKAMVWVESKWMGGWRMSLSFCRVLYATLLCCGFGVFYHAVLYAALVVVRSLSFCVCTFQAHMVCWAIFHHQSCKRCRTELTCFMLRACYDFQFYALTENSDYVRIKRRNETTILLSQFAVWQCLFVTLKSVSDLDTLEIGFEFLKEVELFVGSNLSPNQCECVYTCVSAI